MNRTKGVQALTNPSPAQDGAGWSKSDAEPSLQLTLAMPLLFTRQIIIHGPDGNTMLTFEAFIASDPRLRNAWVCEPGLSIYVRRPTGFSHNADFELASMEADAPGGGSLTSFLDRNETSYSFYVENILNERLISFFTRRGYRIVGASRGEPDVCMITARCWHMRDD